MWLQKIFLRMNRTIVFSGESDLPFADNAEDDARHDK